jgi:multiple sugar transport system substrate-binding protein
MTWDHPRGVDPLVAASRVWQQQGGMEIVWDRRSLQDFEMYPVQQLAREYDLIVIDHPHVGQVVAEQCLLPFAPARLDGIAQGALGQSLESYRWGGQVWALPIDAAAQVQVCAPERLPMAPTTWNGVLALAEQGRVACPLLPPHSVLSLFTLYGLQGGVPLESGSPLLAPERGEAALRALGQLYRLIDPACLDMDPIAVLEAMAASDARIDLAPIIFGYVSYAREGFGPDVWPFPIWRRWGLRARAAPHWGHGDRRVVAGGAWSTGGGFRTVGRGGRSAEGPLCAGGRPTGPCRGVERCCGECPGPRFLLRNTPHAGCCMGAPAP